MRVKHSHNSLLEPEELAAFLKIDRVQVFRMHLRGRIPGYRLGQKQVRFDLTEVLAALRNPNNRGPYKNRRRKEELTPRHEIAATKDRPGASVRKPADIIDPAPWLQPIVEHHPEHHPLAELSTLIEKHVITEDHCKVAIALWVVLSYLIDQVDILPLLAITSPEKRCGNRDF
jgi:hypothetical protein